MSLFSKIPLVKIFLRCSWGQEGGTLASVCESPAVDVVVLAFLTTFFGTGGLPVINFASSCNGPVFRKTKLLQCPQIGYSRSYYLTDFRQDIETCQAAGKIVLLGLGGSVGNYGFSSASQATTFANTLWNLFGEGSSSTRPFGSAVIDGFNLGIESLKRVINL
jgi:chitinase